MGVWAAAAGVQAIELLSLCVPDDGEQIAAHATTGRFDKAQHCIGGNGGIHGIAPGLQNLQADLCRQRLAGRHNAVTRHHGRARPKLLAGGKNVGLRR
jgi:hypothetical protein